MPQPAVLIVDDEQAVRACVGKVLRRSGYEVIEAADGNEALESLRRTHSAIDLVLSDVCMPNMSGIELARIMHTEFPAIPLILMSGYPDREAAESDIEFLQKPFLAAKLLDAVKNVLKPQME